MASRKRNKNESFKKYRLRLRNEEYETREKLKGNLLWNSLQRKTYVRSVHGDLGKY